MRTNELGHIDLAQLERRLKVEAYVCELYSHMSSSQRIVYGFVVYATDADIKQLVCFDFGYATLGETECAALACVLRGIADVTVENFQVLHLDADDDLKAHCNDCDLYRPC